MKAITQDRYGGVDTLALTDIDPPATGPDHLLVRVHAAGVDPGVRHYLTGKPYLMRIMGFGFRAPKARVRGRDLAGTVESVGANVVGFAPGDEVFGVCEDGSYAELARVRPDRVAIKPANVSLEQAAVVPVSGCAALRALRAAGPVGPDTRVLVIGAAGGIGTFAVQLAKAYGAHVTGVCGAAAADLVTAIGADEVIDYRAGEITAGGRRWDVILDIAGGRPLRTLRGALTPSGTLAMVGSEEGNDWIGDMYRPLGAALINPLVRHNLRPVVATERADDLRVLAAMLESGQVTPVLNCRYPLPQVPDALRDLDTEPARGKSLIII